jgi:hypothetical protein
MPLMSEAEQKEIQEANPEHKASRWHKSKLRRIAITAVTGIVLLAGAFLAYAYFTTPGAIRKPTFQHYHFRMQLLVDGKPIDFSEKEFQVKAGSDVCTANLTQQPIHFHDNKDQMVHIHWDGVSGGMVLKYYGWNFIGGLHGTMGFRFDELPKLVNVPIHGNNLPAVPDGANFYVYTGDENSYKQKAWNDFVHKDLETFFGKKSNLPTDTESTSLLNKLFPKAYAHGDEEHAETLPTVVNANLSQEELKQLNNLIGNVVIFVQKDKPSAKEVKARFDKLAPLPQSTCAG